MPVTREAMASEAQQMHKPCQLAQPVRVDSFDQDERFLILHIAVSSTEQDKTHNETSQKIHVDLKSSGNIVISSNSIGPLDGNAVPCSAEPTNFATHQDSKTQKQQWRWTVPKGCRSETHSNMQRQSSHAYRNTPEFLAILSTVASHTQRPITCRQN